MSTSRVIARFWPYATVVIAIVVQGALVVFIMKAVAPYLHVADFGGWIAWGLFVLGGWAIGLLALRSVREGEEFSDPLHVACCWAQRKLGLVGFVLNALVMGSMGASIALKHEGRGHLKVRSFAAAVLYASLWIPLYLEVPFLR